ncbi:MAG: glycosyl hydrolase family 18 protein [Tumebacillaceae bacterium]
MKKRLIAASLVVPVLFVGIMALAPHQSGGKTVTFSDSAPVSKKPAQEQPKQAPEPQTTPSILGFYTVYNSADHKAYNAMAQYGASMNEVATMTFNYVSSGAVVGTAPTDGVQLANSKHIMPFAAIANKNNDGFDQALGHHLLTSTGARTAAINSAVNLVKQNGYQGINLDFENLLPADRPYFSKFVNDLAAELHRHNAKLIVSVMAKTSDSPKSHWVGAFDYAALGKAADQIQLMTYDEHGSWDATPGAVASLPWVEKVLTYSVSQIPSHKLLLGLAAYGYDWDLGNMKNNKAVAWKNVGKLLTSTRASAQWDATAESPYFKYTAANGAQHVVYYENGTSIQAKTKLVNDYKLAGVAMWHVGLEDQSFWQAVQAGLQVKKL